jgi:uncharacterized membrane protein
MPGTDDKSNDIEILKLVHAHFDQDLREFWVRNNMYLVVNGVLVSVFSSSAFRGKYYLAVGLFGLMVSIFWFVVARASYKWIRAWRKELCLLDIEVDRFQVISRVESLPRRSMWSASWTTQWLPLAVSIGWVLLLISAIATGNP